MIGHCHSLATSTPEESGHAARQAAHMMGVDDPCPAQRTWQPWREWVGRVAAQPAHSAQRADPQSRCLLEHTAMATKRDQLAVDLARQSARQLERVAFTTAE
jgi:hypothetical protein